MPGRSLPPRYSTLLIGERTFDIPEHGPLIQIVRIAREETAGTFVVIGVDRTFSSLADAKAHVDGGEGRVCWWESSSGEPGAPLCFVCGCFNGGFPESPQRHPRRLCVVCELEVVDATGRSLRFSNTSLSGGFQAHYVDTGEPYRGHTCYVRGIECRADEARFGGIVVEAVSVAR